VGEPAGDFVGMTVATGQNGLGTVGLGVVGHVGLRVFIGLGQVGISVGVSGQTGITVGGQTGMSVGGHVGGSVATGAGVGGTEGEGVGG
jgi:hypothetical protein